jgi:putative SOS response-associated peptidase YedK
MPTRSELQATLHDRMPIILEPLQYDAWLDPANEVKDKLQAMLRPFPAEQMIVRQVSTFVNNARNEGAECIELAAGK